ncbi:MAG TPA: hypothetical protein VGC72_09085 [Candidatus Elarobacter sp.]|jgi:hypothetical protein
MITIILAALLLGVAPSSAQPSTTTNPSAAAPAYVADSVEPVCI